MTSEAIILAGGLGTRLASVLGELPKCMATIHGRPFLSYLLDYLHKEGIKKVILSIGHLGEGVEQYFGDHYGHLDLIYAFEKEPLGTGGAIAFARTFCNENEFFVLNGDTLFKTRLAEMADFHSKMNADLSIALKFKKDFERYGNVILSKENKVLKFEGKGHYSEGWINGGTYLMKTELFEGRDNTKFSLENDYFPALIETHSVYGFQADSYFIDIGIPEDYERAAKEIK